MPNYNDFYQKEIAVLSNVVATGTSTARSLNKNNGGGATINTMAVPIQTAVVVSRPGAAGDPVATVGLEGSLDGTNWVPIGSLTAMPVGAALKRDVFINVCMMYVRLNVTAYTSGGYTGDLMLQGYPS